MAAVTLNCTADINKLITSVHSARRAVLQANGAAEESEERKKLEAFLLKRTANFVDVLSLCTSVGAKSTAEDPSNHAAELEEQVESLQQQVLVASRRVAELRSSVPAAVLEDLKGKLEHCRPPVVEQAAEGAAPHDSAEGAAAALSPAPAELQDRFASATDKMPALRAKLGEALERLQRIVAVMAADAEAVPPNTVERAARGLATPAAARPAASTADGTPSPKLAEAVSSGKVMTRRRIASSLRPVPYPRQ